MIQNSFTWLWYFHAFIRGHPHCGLQAINYALCVHDFHQWNACFILWHTRPTCLFFNGTQTSTDYPNIIEFNYKYELLILLFFLFNFSCVWRAHYSSCPRDKLENFVSTFSFLFLFRFCFFVFAYVVFNFCRRQMQMNSAHVWQTNINGRKMKR